MEVGTRMLTFVGLHVLFVNIGTKIYNRSWWFISLVHSHIYIKIELQTFHFEDKQVRKPFRLLPLIWTSHLKGVNSLCTSQLYIFTNLLFKFFTIWKYLMKNLLLDYCVHNVHRHISLDDNQWTIDPIDGF